MEKIRLALIGKAISHSKSPEIYQKKLKIPHSYELLDFKAESDLPSPSFLLQNYDGINITSPFKRHYFKMTAVDDRCMKLGAVNCLKIQDGKIFSTNTDFLAMKDLLPNFGNISDVVILGSGVMAQITAHLLNEEKIPYVFYSRKLKNLQSFSQRTLQFSHDTLIINCLSRDVPIKLDEKTQAKFWDLNYGIQDHDLNLSKKVSYYANGLELLDRQADHAIAFWSFKNPK